MRPDELHGLIHKCRQSGTLHLQAVETRLTLCWTGMPCPDYLEMTAEEQKGYHTQFVEAQNTWTLPLHVPNLNSTHWNKSSSFTVMKTTTCIALQSTLPQHGHTFEMSSSWFAKCALQCTQLYRLWHSSGIKSWNLRLPMAHKSSLLWVAAKYFCCTSCLRSRRWRL